MALDFSHLFPPNTAEKKTTLLPTSPASEVKTGANGSTIAPWQQLASLPTVLVPVTDTLLKTQSPISAWQQTNTHSFNATVQQPNTFKFAMQEQPQPETNRWLAPSQTTGVSSNNKTSTKKLLDLYKASAPKATQGDGKLIVGGQGNFSSIEKGGTGGLFASETTDEEG